MIRKQGGKYLVLSHDGKRKFGTYQTMAQARRRLRQMEMFKSLRAKAMKPRRRKP